MQNERNLNNGVNISATEQTGNGRRFEERASAEDSGIRTEKHLGRLPKSTYLNSKKAIKSNPTIDSSRAAALQSSLDPDSLKKKYVMCCLESNEMKPKKVFKISTAIVTTSENYQIEILATDNINSLVGEDVTSVQKYKRSSDWPLNDSVVIIYIHKLSNSTSTVFCTDILSFLHTFNDPEMLKYRMIDVSKKLTESWNNFNMRLPKGAPKSDNYLPLIMDKRKIEKMKKPSYIELTMTGTTYNYVQSIQDDEDENICVPENVFFKLCYQTPDSSIPKKGQAVLSRDDWIDVMLHPQFRDFYDQLWDKCPLTPQYSLEIQEYFKTRKGVNQIIFNSHDTNNSVSQTEEVDGSTSAKLPKNT